MIVNERNFGLAPADDRKVSAGHLILSRDLLSTRFKRFDTFRQQLSAISWLCLTENPKTPVLSCPKTGIYSKYAPVKRILYLTDNTIMWDYGIRAEVKKFQTVQENARSSVFESGSHLGTKFSSIVSEGFQEFDNDYAMSCNRINARARTQSKSINQKIRITKGKCALNGSVSRQPFSILKIDWSDDEYFKNLNWE
jgi:hypothetical protein